MALEKDFERAMVTRLYTEFPGIHIAKIMATRNQGMPDRALFFPDGRWALLEFKKSAKAPKQPNQAYYVDKLNSYSYAAFIYPENEEDIFRELHRSFGPTGTTCVS